MANMQKAIDEATQKSLVEFKQDHTDGISGTAHTPGGGENAPTAKARRGDRGEGEKGMNKLDSKNAGLEQGKSAKGSPGENKRPADKDGAYKGGMEKLDSKSSGLEQGKSPYSKSGTNQNQDPMPKLDSKNSGLEPHGYAEEVSIEEKLDAILDQMGELSEDEIDDLYLSLMEGPKDPAEEDDEDEEDGGYEEPLDDDMEEDIIFPDEIIKANPKVTKEDLNLEGALGSIFEESGDLSEEFKKKAYTIFETALLTVVNKILEERNKELEENYILAVEGTKQGLVETLDAYLDTVVENWEHENELAITAGLRTEILEDLCAGLKNVFLEHYINIPEEAVDVLDQVEQRMNEMEDRLNNEIEKNIGLKEEISAYKREAVLYDVCDGMSDLDIEKVRTFAENVEFINEKDYTEKVQTIVENYFAPKKSEAKRRSNDIAEENLAVGEEIPDAMQKIVEHINKSARPFSVRRGE